MDLGHFGKSGFRSVELPKLGVVEHLGAMASMLRFAGPFLFREAEIPALPNWLFCDKESACDHSTTSVLPKWSKFFAPMA